MVIHNASFIIEREREEAFVEWLRQIVAERVSYAESGPCRPVLTAMREAGGVDYRQAEAQTVAWQVQFDCIESARAWSASTLAGIGAAFEEKFGPNAMLFTSIFEIL